MFLSAKPVFAEGMQSEMNVQLGFYATVPSQPHTVLRLCGASMNQI